MITSVLSPAASIDYAALLDSVQPVVARAAAKLVEMQRSPLHVERKDLLDIVTEADLAAEEIVVSGLLALTPGAAILAEERGAIQGAAPGRWIIDPLDGTINFANGLPSFSVTVAYELEGEICLGMISAPAAGLEARYARGRPATVNGMPAQVRPTSSLSDAVISVCLTSHFSDSEVRQTAAIIERLGRVARGVRIMVSGAYEMALVASGKLDGFISIKADVVSHAAGMQLVRAGGGRVTRLDGHDAAVDDLVRICSNGHVHDELLDHLREAIEGADR
jgi:fructose-1,6-bisphosphatase/inositol monophosphatase family enzyme